MNKFERQGAILRLVQERPLATQAEVAEALREAGIEAVQTTVSRDIAQLGLVKVRAADGRLVYALPGAADLDRLSELTTALRRWTSSMTAANGLVVDPARRAATRRRSPTRSTRRASATSPARSRARTRSSSRRATASRGAELEELLRHHLEGDT